MYRPTQGTGRTENRWGPSPTFDQQNPQSGMISPSPSYGGGRGRNSNSSMGSNAISPNPFSRITPSPSSMVPDSQSYVIGAAATRHANQRTPDLFHSTGSRSPSLVAADANTNSPAFEQGVAPNQVVQTKARHPHEGKGLAASKDAQVASEHLYRHPRMLPHSNELKKNCCTVSFKCRSDPQRLGTRTATASSVGKLFEDTVADCQAAVKRIARSCDLHFNQTNASNRGRSFGGQSAGTSLFFDQEWPLDHRDTLYPRGAPDDCSVAEPKAQRRLSELYPNRPLFGPRQADTTISQGKIGDCFFLGAMMALHNTPGLSQSPLQKLIAASDPQRGIYGVVFYKNGSWEWVVIDDFVPVEGNSPLYVSCSSEEVWPMVLEKAYAKMHHCWDTIDGGWEREALVDMTGGFEQLLDLYGSDRDIGYSDLVHLAESGRAVVVAHVGPQAKETSGGRRAAPAVTQGLLHGHAYQLVGGLDRGNGEVYIKLRNHWGKKGAWRGAFGEGSPQYSQHDFTMSSSSDPQVNWMTWRDFSSILTKVTVVEFVDTRSGSLTMYGQSRHLSPESTYVVNVKGSVKLSLQLTVGQEDPKMAPISDHALAKESKHHELQLLIQKLSKVPDRFSDIKAFVQEDIPTIRRACREVDITVDLDPGSYTLHPVCNLAEVPLYIRAIVPQGFAVDIRRFDDRHGRSRVTSEAAALVISKPIDSNTDFSAVYDQRAAKGASLSTELLPKHKVVGGGYAGPEHIYRNPRCNPTLAELSRESSTSVAPAPGTRSIPTPINQRPSGPIFLGSSYEEAVSTVRYVVQSLSQQCRSQGKKYIDKTWALTERVNLYPDGAPMDCTVAEPSVLARLSELYPKRSLFARNPKSTKIKQGMMGDCFLLGAMMALHNTPVVDSSATHSPLKQLIVNCDQQSGIYGVVFYKNGSWEWVVIDDFVPVEGNSPLYVSCSSEEVWPMLLEKAYAKMHHCWDTIDGGWEREALVDMTGGYISTLDLKRKSVRCSFDEFQGLIGGGSETTVNSETRNLIIASLGPHLLGDTASPKPIQAVHRPNRGDPGQGGIGAGTSAKAAAKSTNGLLHGHAYHVIGSYSSGDQAHSQSSQFVLIRNYWGPSYVWKGSHYGEGSLDWKRNKHLANALLPICDSEPAGNLFWIPWEDFKHHLSSVTVLHQPAPPSVSQEPVGGGLSTSSSGASTTEALCLSNLGKRNPVCPDQTYVVEIGTSSTRGATTPPQTLLWTLCQEDPKMSPDHKIAKNEKYAMLEISIYRLKKVPQRYADLMGCLDTKVLTTTQSSGEGGGAAAYCQELTLPLTLEPGYYSVIAKLSDCKEGIPFFLRITIPTRAKKQDPSVFVSAYRLDNPASTAISTKNLASSSNVSPVRFNTAADPPLPSLKQPEGSSLGFSPQGGNNKDLVGGASVGWTQRNSHQSPLKGGDRRSNNNNNSSSSLNNGRSSVPLLSSSALHQQQSNSSGGTNFGSPYGQQTQSRSYLSNPASPIPDQQQGLEQQFGGGGSQHRSFASQNKGSAFPFITHSPAGRPLRKGF